MSTADREWMRRLCCTDGDPYNAHKAAPFSVKVGKLTFDVATDGKALVAVEGAALALSKHRKMVTIVKMVLSEPAGKLGLNLADVLAWAGAPEWPAWETCPSCEGKGGACSFCADVLPGSTGGDSTGTGRAWNLRQRAGWFGPIPVDRNLVARALHHFTPTSIRVRIGSPEQPIYFDGAGWRAIVMPMRTQPEHDGAPVFALPVPA